MRILVGRESRAALVFAFDEGACDIAPLSRFAVGLLDCPDDQRGHRSSGLLRAPAQLVVQGLGDNDRGPDCHNFIMLLAKEFAEHGQGGLRLLDKRKVAAFLHHGEPGLGRVFLVFDGIARQRHAVEAPGQHQDRRFQFSQIGARAS
jgi:hypothetical protein